MTEFPDAPIVDLHSMVIATSSVIRRLEAAVARSEKLKEPMAAKNKQDLDGMRKTLAFLQEARTLRTVGG